MKTYSPDRSFHLTALVFLSSIGLLAAANSNWVEQAVSPVGNPLFFEDPHIKSEIRPLFMYHNIDDDFLAGGGDVKVYAIQARWAVTDRLAIIATKDGYIDTDFDDVPALSDEGFADLAVGAKYAIFRSDNHEFIVTPGVKFEFPIGDDEVFQGNGDGEWDLFVSAAKSWDRFRILGSLGARLPNDWDEETAQSHYSAQVDYRVCQYLVPFVAINAFTVLSEGDNALPLDVEGSDLINFGSPDAQGETTAAAGVGFRSRLCRYSELGFAYEVGVGNPKGLFDDRFTVDLILRF